ncbi:glycosyltransferase [Pectinatus haikarae]|uniref:glycosyltransferase n=1 Tax=Pectinatus haikarae TaxID=349096 RepID=UPI0018C7A863|nr:glycosyltransferase [Pectinatus haikarae]
MLNFTDKKISIIIPTLNASKYIGELLNSLIRQTVLPSEIIIIDSSSEDDTEKICRNFALVKFISIERQAFDHGRTRAMAAEMAIGEYLLFITQDAIPANENYIESILQPFLEDDNVSMVTGRQCPRDDSRCSERLTRTYNYPGKSYLRTKKDISTYGIKTFFSSNVCAAYKKICYEAIGGFDYPLPSGEDIIIAAKFIYAGYSVVYKAEAQVIHSHNYTLWQQFTRNFDAGVYLALYGKYFKNVKLNLEGLKMVNYVLRELIREGQISEGIYYVCECIVKFMGNKLGMKYKFLPYFFVKKCSMNKNYWKGMTGNEKNLRD